MSSMNLTHLIVIALQLGAAAASAGPTILSVDVGDDEALRATVTATAKKTWGIEFVDDSAVMRPLERLGQDGETSLRRKIPIPAGVPPSIAELWKQGLAICQVHRGQPDGEPGAAHRHGENAESECLKAVSGFLVRRRLVELAAAGRLSLSVIRSYDGKLDVIAANHLWPSDEGLLARGEATRDADLVKTITEVTFALGSGNAEQFVERLPMALPPEPTRGAAIIVVTESSAAPAIAPPALCGPLPRTLQLGTDDAFSRLLSAHYARSVEKQAQSPEAHRCDVLTLETMRSLEGEYQGDDVIVRCGARDYRTAGGKDDGMSPGNSAKHKSTALVTSLLKGLCAKPKVTVMDGVCVGAQPCTNPRVQELAAKIKTGHYEVTLGAPVKKARATTELWFAPGKEAQAKKLAAEQLAGLVKGEAQAWTWGGDFDVLVIVGP